jgi:NAD(P)-dependent dehydrogenase (short-subunit alcohol dehydrogenase family)
VAEGSVVIVGGTRGLGRELARRYAERGADVVLTGRDPATACQVAAEIGGATRGLAVDLTRPQEIPARLEEVGRVQRLVLAAIQRDANTARDYDVERAVELFTLKLVGYTQTIHTLLGRMTPEASILLFGGLAKDRPYPGSITVSTANGGVTGLVHALVVELAPIRINAIHPAIVGDSPEWVHNAEMLQLISDRTPTGRCVTMDEVVDAAHFLLENTGVNGVDLVVDGGSLLR